MATIMIGSARINEKGTASGGTAGDQKQTSSTNDLSGEVSMQAMYTHSLGWYVFRPKTVALANALAAKMITACNNVHIGYDQGSTRLGVITYGVNSTVDTGCDCGSLVRACVKEASGTDPGNFNTATEATALMNTKLFEDKFAYVNQTSTPLYNGDILVTKTKGHTAIVVSGNARSTTTTTTATTTTTSQSKVLQVALKKDASLAGTYKTTANLNLRYGADADKYASMVVMPKGTSFRNYGYYNVNGTTKWLYGVATVNSKSYTGYASINYMSK